MKKTILTISIVALFVVYILYQKFSGTSAVALPPTAQVAENTTSDATSIDSTPVNISAANATPANLTPLHSTPPIKKPIGQYKNGQYTGNVADAYYGNVQVVATISNGKITNVQFLQYPSDREESRQISGAATPQLASEAIQAQSANVDVVSGATQTSEAFKLSLATALSQARN